MTANDFEILVQRHLDERMRDNDLQKLQANLSQWVETLFKLLEQTDKSIARVRRQFRGVERRTVLEDLNSEADRIDKVLTEILGPTSDPESIDFESEELSLIHI